MARTWSMDEVSSHPERLKDIDPPFTADERDLARNLASAWLYWEVQEELSGRTPSMAALNGALSCRVSCPARAEFYANGFSPAITKTSQP
jgi:hypothetical protein